MRATRKPMNAPPNATPTRTANDVVSEDVDPGSDVISATRIRICYISLESLFGHKLNGSDIYAQWSSNLLMYLLLWEC